MTTFKQNGGLKLLGKITFKGKVEFDISETGPQKVSFKENKLKLEGDNIFIPANEWFDEDDNSALISENNCGNDYDSWQLLGDITTLMGYADKNGNIMIKQDYDMLSSIYEGVLFFKKDPKWGLMTVKGDIIIPAKYDVGDDIPFFNDGFAPVRLENLGWGYVNVKGEEVIS